MPQIMSGDDVARTVRRIAHQMIETRLQPAEMVLVGIHTRGVPLAGRIAQELSALVEAKVPVGELDIGLYRDDRDERSDIPLRETRIPVDLTRRHVIVVDDVLYTGRTVRAALDALSDIGRAKSTELAVLVDRGHRELPIRADYVGKNIPTSREERVAVRLREIDGTDGVFVERVVVV